MASPELQALIAELAGAEESETLAQERRAWDQACAPLDPLPEVEITAVDAGGVPCLSFLPPRRQEGTILYCHGGAFVIGSSWHNRGMLSRLALAASVRVIGVDYRLAPEAPFPAGLDDADTAYRWLLGSGVAPGSVLLAGDSCGANLVLGVALRSRQRGEAPAAALACLSPWVDLTLAGDSLTENRDLDPFITRENLEFLSKLYLDGADAADPAASPLFADLEGLPPMLIQVGSDEALLSDAVALCRRAEAAEVPARLEAVPEVVHVWQVWAGVVPESMAALERVADFFGSKLRPDSA